MRWGWLAPVASNVTWDSDASTAIFERQARIVRDAGALAELPMYLSALAMDKMFTGDLEGAELLDSGERQRRGGDRGPAPALRGAAAPVTRRAGKPRRPPDRRHDHDG